jgi:predicted amidophosphoribosyltransferase
MEYVIYICPNCLYESKEPGVCPRCNATLIASCPACGNPVVGEHIHLDE